MSIHIYLYAAISVHFSKISSQIYINIALAHSKQIVNTSAMTIIAKPTLHLNMYANFF